MFLERQIVVAAGATLMVTGWILIAPAKWKPQASRITRVLVFVGTCMVAAGIMTVVQARN